MPLTLSGQAGFNRTGGPGVKMTKLMPSVLPSLPIKTAKKLSFGPLPGQ